MGPSSKPIPTASTPTPFICKMKPLDYFRSLGYIPSRCLNSVWNTKESGNDSIFPIQTTFHHLDCNSAKIKKIVNVCLSKLTFSFEMNDNGWVPGEVGISVLKTMLEQVLLSLRSTRHSDKTPIKVPNESSAS